jgi:hypothetical protein
MGERDDSGLELLFDPRRLRQCWLAELSRALDLYLRSPVFLEWLRCSLTAMNEARSLCARWLDVTGVALPALPPPSSAPLRAAEICTAEPTNGASGSPV